MRCWLAHRPRRASWKRFPPRPRRSRNFACRSSQAAKCAILDSVRTSESFSVQTDPRVAAIATLCSSLLTNAVRTNQINARNAHHDPPSGAQDFRGSRMSFFAGIVLHTPDGAISDDVAEKIRKALNRRGDDITTEFRWESGLLVKGDIGAFDSAGVYESESGAVTLLAGHPLLGDSDITISRVTEAAQIGASLECGDYAALAAARGTFASAHYDPRTKRLALVADRLGVRPIYYLHTREITLFSTTLRAFSALDSGLVAMDSAAVTSMIALGFPLGTTTPYSAVRTIDAAEVITVDSGLLTSRRYFDWTKIRINPAPRDEVMDHVYQTFRAAVVRRLGSDRTTAAFLSGGLDSRCVVAALRGTGANVYTFNFSTAGSEDQLFAELFAARIDTTHETVLRPPGVPQWASMLADAWAAAAEKASIRPEHPRLVWSGDGGSVTLGRVYISDSIVRLLREGQTRRAIQAYLTQQGAAAPSGILTASAAAELRMTVEDGVIRELERYPHPDPAMSFLLFLMLNDQRRHLAKHFEDVDLHRVEYQLPFFDAEFLEATLTIPFDWAMGHSFYNEWLHHFQPATHEVPWQAYPGHAPCPVPRPAGLSYQWDSGTLGRVSARTRLGDFRKSLQTILSGELPSGIVSRPRLLAASIIHALGLRDYRYLIRAADTYHQYSC